ncbi:putative nicotinate phosphoribosyltransferase [compost metagenome]
MDQLFAAFNSDGYKLGHADMYAHGTSKVYSNLTPRSDRIHRTKSTRYYDGKLIWIGGQGAIMEIHDQWQTFFAMNKEIAVKQFQGLVDAYLGEGVVSPKRLEQLHDLGYLPLEIKTLDEGTKVPMGIPVLTITNTVDHAFWLVNFLETLTSSLTWKTPTNCTIAGEYKAMLKDFAIKTGTPLEAVTFQAHDFSARGMSGPEDAARSGFAHIAQFLGTDTLTSILYAKKYYGASGFIAASVPATEHAVSSNNILSIEMALCDEGYEFVTDEQKTIHDKMSADGHSVRLIAEAMFMYDLIMVKFPTGIVSYVADTYDFWAVLTIILPYLRDAIMRREASATTPGKLVIRPDSGNPVTVVCGMKPVKGGDGKAIDFESEDAAYDYLEHDDNAYHSKDSDCVKIAGVFYDLEVSFDSDGYWHGCGIDMKVVYPYEVVAGAVRTLYKTFGGTLTETGHKMMDSHIGLIYGDSITPQRCLDILEGLEGAGYASGNTVFGVGSYTYQCNTRDTFGFAVKATHSIVNDTPVAIFKDPKTDSKKKSAKGLLFVGTDEGGDYVLMDNMTPDLEASKDNYLTVRYKDGNFYNLTSLDEIRARLA